MGRFHRHDGDEHGHSHAHADGEHEHGDGHGDGHDHGHGPADGHEHTHDHDHDHDHPHEHSHDRSDDIGDMTGYATGAERVDVLEAIFAENDDCADRNRHDLDAAGAVAINLMSSPGAGKTALLQRTLAALDGAKVGIVEGDIETSIDADRLQGYGASIALVNTGDGFGGECHLDAPMVRSALPRLPLDDLSLVIVENVGNLVCPAEFSVGEHHKAMVYSVTEGEEKPLKYPVMFRSVELVLINKIDLLPYLDVDLALFRANLEKVNPGVRTIEVSARTGEGVQEWVDWLTAVAPGAAR